MNQFNPSDCLKSDLSEGEDCVICEKKIPRGDKVVAVEVTIGSSFIKALQKKLRKECHVHCAENIHGVLGLRIAEAKK